ncbi:MAG: NADH-quinone oxidoreductase subunit [Micromonosporaceae bacterium]|nr:NADH-quinone oxidoreductase subunit [Micromonosporaceae bacterium]
MMAQEVGDRLARLLHDNDGGDAAPGGVEVSPLDGGGAAPARGVEVSLSGGGSWARATVDVAAGRWRDALRAARDDAELSCDFFDWLSAVDELEAGFRLVAHVWSTNRRHGLLIRTLVGRDSPALASVVDLYPGAGWHERETHEMFGIDFPGHPGLVPLLLPAEFEGYPLRKEFVLASRVAKPWPGAKEPGESRDSTAARRQPMRPPGVPDPAEWGPNAASAAAAPEGGA